MTTEELIEIVQYFRIEGSVAAVKPLGKGLINDTFLVKTQESDKPDYVLQRINHYIFTDVELLQHNIEALRLYSFCFFHSGRARRLQKDACLKN